MARGVMIRRGRSGSLRAMSILATLGMTMNGCGNSQVGAIPPIGISGSVGEMYRTSKFSDEPRENVNQVDAALRARTYIWQPWFVTTDAGARLAYQTKTGGTSADGDAELVGGEMNLGILPLSRIPTTISYSRTDSRIDGSMGSDYTRDRAAIVQRSMFGSSLRTLTRLSYETIDQPEAGDETIRSGAFNITKMLDRGTLGLSLDHSDSEFLASVPEEQDETEETNSATLVHSFTPSSVFRMQNTLSFIQDEEDTEFQNFDRTTVQGVSTQQWRPTNYPFTINGALRASSDALATDAAGPAEEDTDTSLVSAAVGLNYPIRPRLTANVGVNGLYQKKHDEITDDVGVMTVADERTAEASLVGSVSYLSLPKPVGSFQWRWNAGANGRGQYRDVKRDDNDPVQRFDGSGGTTIGHSLMRPIPVPFLGPGQFGFSQTGRVDLNSDDPEDDLVVPSLAHSANVTYSANEKGVSTYFRFSASDRREFIAFDAVESQLVQLQLNRNSFIDVQETWTAALTVQGSRQRRRNDGANYSLSAAGRLGYVDQRLFDVQNLMFSSELELNAVGLEDVIRNEMENRFERERRADWTNRIQYRVGMITTSLEGSLFYIGDDFGNSVFFRIRRDFNGVF